MKLGEYSLKRCIFYFAVGTKSFMVENISL